MVDGVGSTIYGYDTVGQLLSEDGPWPNDAVNLTYANRLRTSMSVAAPGSPAWTQDYGYDLGARLTNVTSLAGSFGYAYDTVKLERVDDLSLPNGAVITNSYDSVARLLGTWLMTSQGSNLDSYVYTYNRAGQRTNVVRTAGEYVSYAYDSAGQLTNAASAEPGGISRADQRLSYAYDAAGNLAQKKVGAPLMDQTLYGLNGLNEITNATIGNWNPLTGWQADIAVSGATTSPATNVILNGVSVAPFADNTFARYEAVNAGSNGFTATAQDIYGRSCTNSVSVNVIPTNNAYTYDLNGNLLADGTRSFAYDDENQLISVWRTNVWRNDFVYDGRMRRRIERDYTWNGSAWSQTNEIHFIYDGNLVVQERDSNNVPQVTYTRGIDLSGKLQGAGGIGGLLARSENPSLVNPGLASSATAYYHADGNGNVTALVSAGQMLVAKYLYDPFGNILAQYGAMADANKYRFSSKEWNGNSGLYYYLYRFYDPNLQRWPNRDPLEDEASLARLTAPFDQGTQSSVDLGPFESWGGVNLYAYVGNNPLNFIDPFGTSSVDSTISAAIADGNVADLQALLDDNILDETQATRVQNALNKLRSKASDWISQKCKGSINQEFPSQLRNKTLQEIKQMQKQGDDAARKAWKLLNDNRFRK